MNRVTNWTVGIFSLAIGAVALAAAPADTAPTPQEKPAAQKSDTPAAAAPRKPRLVLPWSQLADLSDVQKEKILAVLGKGNDEIAKIRAKERTDIMTILTDEQQKKAEEIDATRGTRARTTRRATSQPAAGKN